MSVFNRLKSIKQSLPFELFVGMRYTRAKRRNHFISFISLTSMVGIGLGVAALIVVLSVMNGFDEEIHKRFFGMAPEITLSGMTGKISQWPRLMDELQHTPGVKAPPGTNFWTAVTREQVAANPDIAAQQINTLKGQLQTQIEKNLTLLKRLNEVLSQRK